MTENRGSSRRHGRRGHDRPSPARWAISSGLPDEPDPEPVYADPSIGDPIAPWNSLVDAIREYGLPAPKPDDGTYTGPSVGYLFTPWGWLFIGLAVLYLVATVVSTAQDQSEIVGAMGGLNWDSVLEYLPVALQALATASPLLVAAVVLGRGDAGWRRNGALAAGAFLLALPAAVVAVLSGLYLWVLTHDSSPTRDLQVLGIHQIAGIASIAGPVLIGIGLSRAMAARVGRPPQVAIAAVIAIAIYESGENVRIMWQQTRRMQEEGWADFVSFTPIMWLQAILAGGFLIAAAWPVGVCLTARRTKAGPRRFWTLLLFGFGLSLAVTLGGIALRALWRNGIDFYSVAGLSVGHILNVGTIVAMVAVAVALFRWEPGYR